MGKNDKSREKERKSHTHRIRNRKLPKIALNVLERGRKRREKTATNDKNILAKEISFLVVKVTAAGDSVLAPGWRRRGAGTRLPKTVENW